MKNFDLFIGDHVIRDGKSEFEILFGVVEDIIRKGAVSTVLVSCPGGAQVWIPTHELRRATPIEIGIYKTPGDVFNFTEEYRKSVVNEAHAETTTLTREQTLGGMVHGQGEKEQTTTGAVRESNAGRGRFDLLPFEALEAYAIWSELGAAKYAERNWEDGLSVKDCIGRMFRHAAKAANGWTDEDHLAAVMWNAGAAITMIQRRPDCNDHPWANHRPSNVYYIHPESPSLQGVALGTAIHEGFEAGLKHPNRKKDVILTEDDQYFFTQWVYLNKPSIEEMDDWLSRRRKDNPLDPRD